MRLLRLLVFITFVYHVDGQCLNGTYGPPSCSKRCGFCRNADPCDKMTGACEGCAAGYQGILCQSGCSMGFYGENCRLRCDTCVYNSCDAVNGTCKNTTSQPTESTSPVSIFSTEATQPPTTTQKKGLVFDSPAVLLGLSVPMLALVGAGTVIFFLIIAIICHTLINKCCPRKSQVEPTYTAKRKRSERSMSFVYKKWSSKPT
ncbi:platelet endothelial aggregation receptor 1-like [Ostrea edulis]|uniref:platelet endothelial aggregation receptor 1-like n=1 Tax=Ostrea edulis TaxID=37623 RepID=UPI0024AEF784|nr:platelet endothelial aggregation receptor 1-like [Ostrea edulis]